MLFLVRFKTRMFCSEREEAKTFEFGVLLFAVLVQEKTPNFLFSRIIGSD